MIAKGIGRFGWWQAFQCGGLVCVLGILGVGCGGSRPVKYYVLDSGSRSPGGIPTNNPRFPFTLLVARISSSHLYRDDRLVYGAGPVQLGTYEYQRWAEPPSEMIQDTLIATLRSTGDYRSVSAIGSNLRGEYILRGRLNSLDEVDKPSIAARFSMDIELFDPKTGATLWTDSYSYDEPVKGKTVPDVVEALDRNVHTGLQQLTSNLGRYLTSHPTQFPTAK